MMNEMANLILVLNTLDFDVVCHKYSYGGKDGLLEMWDRKGDNDDVIGYLTAKDVIAYILKKD